MDRSTQRLALGQRFSVASFYDARNERFLPASPMEHSLPSGAVETTDIYSADIKVGDDDTYEKQFDAMGITVGLGVSILAELEKLKGSSVYLNERPRGRALHAALHYTFTTVKETLTLSHAGIKDYFAAREIYDGDATHFVLKVEWGIRSIIAARWYLSSTSKMDSAKQTFRSDFETFLSAVEGLQRPEDHSLIQPTLTSPQPSLELTTFSDILDEGGILMKDYEETFQFLQMMPLHTKAEGNERGLPIMYSLLPIDILTLFLPNLKLSQTAKFKSPTEQCLSSFIQLFGEFQSCQRSLDDLQRIVLANQAYFPPSLLSLISDRQRKRDAAEKAVKVQLARSLQAFRGDADPTMLRQLLAQCQRKELSPRCSADFGMPFRKTVEFLSKAISMNAVYVGYNGSCLEQILPTNPSIEAYALFFTPSAIQSDSSWQANQDLLFELLQTRGPQQVVAVVDCEAMSRILDKVYIAQFLGGRENISDFLEHKRIMADKCFAKCPRKVLKDTTQRSIQRRHVKIPCPGPRCTVAKVREWICPYCMAPIEYGFTDEYIYCDCGRSVFTNYAFNCNSDLHGSKFIPYDRDQLLRLLRGLSQANYLNILILGETGVGKSTFINALVNYLEFETLDDAMAAEKLNYVIPCSFSTQIMDRSDPSRPIEEKRIKVGARYDERDGSTGDSATQQTTVYPVTFSNGDSTLTVRLIDTPGMGDTRGVDFDRKNMADILLTLSGYEDLHGILVLLKPNAARLTISFSYCIKELLTHLHNNAVRNMAFGFTNTRISNYTPGDTYGPLTRLLSQQHNLGLKLSTSTTYCFDSESFRYLAAFKEGTTMPNKEDFDRSWNHSRDESIRLFDYFKAKPPHQIKNTLSLNGARQIITQLTKPMAEISQSINANIAMTEDKMKDLRDTRLSGDQLRNQLHVQMIQINAVPLKKPRTVCGNSKCIEVKDDGQGQNQKITLYVNPCHPVCYLQGIPVDQVAPPGLTDCAAFQGNVTCLQCHHHWQEHLHFLYELVEKTVTVIDSAIQTRLQSNANDITLRETALNQHEQRVAEYKQERDIIRDAAAKFGFFLRKNSLAPYNDALIAYLDHLIKEEQIKVQAGGNNKRLLSLSEERRKHEEAIEAITRQVSANSHANWDPSQTGAVDRIVQQLYGLKHFGNSLKNLKQGIAMAHEATYREMPYTVRGKAYAKLAQRTTVPILGGAASRQGLTRGNVRLASGQTRSNVPNASKQGSQGLVSFVRNRVEF